MTDGPEQPRSDPAAGPTDPAAPTPMPGSGGRRRHSIRGTIAATRGTISATRGTISASLRRRREDLIPQVRAHRVLGQGTAAIVLPIADAIVIKDENLFFLCPPDGRIPADANHGFGLYYHDCRYVSGYDLSVADTEAQPLASTAALGFEAVLELTNPEITMPDGSVILKENLGVHWTRLVDGHGLALHDRITLRNYGMSEIAFPVRVAFQCAFEDVFAIRGLVEGHLGRHHGPEWLDGILGFRYDGADGVVRRTGVHFATTPDERSPNGAAWNVRLGARESRTIEISLVVGEAENADDAAAIVRRAPSPELVEGLQRRSVKEWLQGQTSFRSDSPSLNSVMERSLRDLRMLRSSLEGQRYFIAGIPWFATLFGRDSVITALQTLPFDPGIAADTIRVLAERQGRRVDAWRDEEPGKILHEMRTGELARIGRIPHNPYYGTVDSTPLFLILLARHAHWTGDLALFRSLGEHVASALEWMWTYPDLSGRGYIEYKGTSERGLVNQGWKDSGDSVVTVDGEIATPPIALVEVQAYAYRAYREIAEMYRRTGDAAAAGELERRAAELQERFERDFWMPDAGCYALALQDEGRTCGVISSNAGHALWSGIAAPDRALRTADRLMEPDMFSGWGIRTLSAHERRFNPIGYHLGTVWPHDNSMIGVGFRAYGLDEHAGRLLAGILSAATHFSHHRLPELFAGFDRETYGVPVSYPVACHPQAWAAGTVPVLVESVLGIAPEGLDQRLRIIRPALPDFVHEVELRDMAVAGARVDLRFERRAHGVHVDVLAIRGPLDVEVEGAVD